MDDVTVAIADPVRREILALLRHGHLPAGAIADHFDISRPAVSRHLRILRDAGLVVGTVDGRRRIYRLDVTPLAELDRWLTPFRAHASGGHDRAGPADWGARLDALATEVHRTRRERRPTAGAASVHTRPEPDSEERSA